jgi:hypothetical protein
VNRTIGYAAAGYISALAGHRRAKALTFGLETGLLIGAVTTIVNARMLFIEWTADYVPARRRGVLGVGFILIGFTMQSVQYWLTLLDCEHWVGASNLYESADLQRNGQNARLSLSLKRRGCANRTGRIEIDKSCVLGL